MDKSNTVFRGGPNTERLYEFDARIELPNGRELIVAKSDMPQAKQGMDDVFVRGKARYGLVSLFCRPGFKILDVPCGCGYGSAMLTSLKVSYLGLDIDEPTIAYARQLYGNENVRFSVTDMCTSDFGRRQFDVAACIEGIEHIEQRYQAPLLTVLHQSVRPGGTVIVSSPEPTSGISGKSEHNQDHLWELSRRDFVAALNAEFGEANVEIISQRNIILSTGATTSCLYGICHVVAEEPK